MSTPRPAPSQRNIHLPRLAWFILLSALLAGCQPVVQPLPTPSAVVPTATVAPATPPSPTAPLKEPAVANTTTPTGVPATAVPPRRLALVNGTLMDGRDTAPIPGAALYIEDGRIVAAGPRTAVKIPPDAQVIDVGGAAILPGFINAHVHNGYNSKNLAAWAQGGVTAVRDIGTHLLHPDFTLRDQSFHDPQLARLEAAGPMITAPGGYPIAIFNGIGLEVRTPDEGRQAVNELLDRGVRVIKIALESGEIFKQPGIPMLSKETAAAIIDAAHQRGGRVSAHITATSDLELALDLGVDDLAHMVVQPVPDTLIQRAVRQGVYWVPTLELWQNVGYGFDKIAVDNLRRYVQAGGKVAMGTDYDGYYTPFQIGMPAIEIELMSLAGMSPQQIITAATLNAAYVCNREQELGTLEAGKIADVLVLPGDPLQDIKSVEKIGWVIHNGVVIRAP